MKGTSIDVTIDQRGVGRIVDRGDGSQADSRGRELATTREVDSAVRNTRSEHRRVQLQARRHGWRLIMLDGNLPGVPVLVRHHLLFAGFHLDLKLDRRSVDLFVVHPSLEFDRDRFPDHGEFLIVDGERRLSCPTREPVRPANDRKNTKAVRAGQGD